MRLPCEGQRRKHWSAGRPIARLHRVGDVDFGVLRRRTRVSISASPAHRLLMGRGTGEAKAKMGREITFTRGNVGPLSQFSIAYWQSQETHRGCRPGAAHGSAFRSQNKNIEVVKVLPIAPQPVQIRAGCEAGASAQALRCKADAATTDSVCHWNAKSPTRASI